MTSDGRANKGSQVSNEVVLVGRAELDSIFQSLKKMTDQAQAGADEIGNFGKKTQENLSKVTKKTENDIKKTGGLLRRLASQLYSDFKGLMSLEALQGGLKLSSQFKGAIAESVTLSDTIRRLGGSFGIAKQDFGKFQASLSRGLGDIGASSESAANALQGLTGMGVKGKASIMNLSKGAVTLAGMGGEKGNEKQIAGLLGSTLRSQGKDVNDINSQKALIGEVTAAVTSTGKQASEILTAMDQIFSTMDKQLRGSVGPQGMAQMATMATMAGPMAAKGLQEYLSKSPIERMAMQAQGFNVMGKNGGIDIKKLQEFIKTTQQRTGMDPRKSLMTAGFSEEAAEGFVRLAEKTDDVQAAMTRLASASRDNEAAYRKSMGMMDSFRGSINTVKGRIEEWTQGLSQGITDVLSSQVGNIAGSSAVVGGGAILAATLAGGGLRGIGKGLAGTAGGLLKKEAMEGITGEKVQNVYVVNMSEMGKGGGVGSVASGIGLGTGALVAGGVAIAAGAMALQQQQMLAEPNIDKRFDMASKNDQGFGDKSARAGGGLQDMLVNFINSHKTPKVEIYTKEPNLKVRSEVSRGAGN